MIRETIVLSSIFAATLTACSVMSSRGQPSTSVDGSTGGAGGAAGTGGGGASQVPVTPVLRGGQWAFDLGDVTLQVDPQTGGRITTFQLGTENLLTGPSVNPTYWGSTLWISPEIRMGQPPPAPIDTAPYSVTATATSVTLTGQPFVAVGVSITKVFSGDPVLGAFHVEYKLNNTSQTTIALAPWEVTRVFPRGITFFPTGPSTRLSAGATLPTTSSGGLTWFSYDTNTMNAITVDSKLFADASEGWVAHVVDGLVFIKSFGDVTADKIAPGEGDVELFTNAVHSYIELENQGPYGNIAPGASTSWTVTWFLRRLPANIAATVGNADLAQFVRGTIAGH